MTRMHTDLLSPVIIAGCSGRRVACEPIDLRPTRPPLQNSVPEFRRCEGALTPYGFVMKNSNFRIIPVATEVAATARRVAASGASDHAIVVADSPGGFPCRHC